MKHKTLNFELVSLLVLVMVLAFLLLQWVTVNGIGVSPDSITYIETANSLITGNGFYANGKPLTHYPPVYPLILAAVGFINQDVTTAARWLHAFLYGINAFLFGLCVYKATRRNIAVLIISILLFFSSSAILSVHARAWSESPFLFFILITFLLLNLFHARGRWSHLVLAAIAAGLAIATRYAGIAILPPVILCLWLCSSHPAKKKVLETLVFLALASLPVLAWFIHNLAITSALTDRGLAFHPFGAGSVVKLVDTLHNFILPHFAEGWLNALELAIIIVFLLAMLLGISKDPARSCRAATNCSFHVLFGYAAAFSYLLVLMLTIAFIDAGTPLDDRLLFPVFIMLTISVFATVDQYTEIKNKRATWWIFLACVVFSIRVNLNPLIETVTKLHTSGKGFNSVAWNESPTLAALRTYPADTLVFSNGDDVIRYKTGNSATALPAKYSAMTTEPNENYPEEMNKMCADLENGKTLFVFLNEIDRDYYASQDEVLDACNVPLIYKLRDGMIYGYINP